MGRINVLMTVGNPRTGERSAEFIAIADTGATLSVVPASVLETIGVQRRRRVGLVYADGRRTRRDIGEVDITVNDVSTTCAVIFGEPDDATLLGVTALELLGLVVDPVQRRLVPTDYLNYAFS